jgi:aminomethyltransferase
MSTPPQKTPLYEQHQERKGRLIDFSGWLLPVSFSGVLAEHQAVRDHVGLFDVSHMGEVRVSGPDAVAFLQHSLTNDLRRLDKNGRGQYTAMLSHDGGFVDDLICYRIEQQEYFLCINAGNVQKDFDWLTTLSKSYDVVVENESAQWAQIAVQGPQSTKLLMSCFPQLQSQGFAELGYMTAIHTNLGAQDCMIARTGYTGETGYEIYLPQKSAAGVWTSLADCQEVAPALCGLGARDTLRLEACYLLYGNDMDEQINPLEAGIKWALKKPDAPDFVGKKSLELCLEGGVPRKTVAFKMSETGIPRHGMKVFAGDMEIGVVSSGSVLPTVGGAGGMALIQTQSASIGDTVSVDIRGKRRLAKLVRRPLYKAKV